MIEVAYLQFLPSTRTGEKLLTHTLLIVVMLGLFYIISLSISMAILHYVFSGILYSHFIWVYCFWYALVMWLLQNNKIVSYLLWCSWFLCELDDAI